MPPTPSWPSDSFEISLSLCVPSPALLVFRPFPPPEICEWVFVYCPCPLADWKLPKHDVLVLNTHFLNNWRNKGINALVCVLSHDSHVWLSVTLWTVASRLLCPWDSPGKNTGVGCHCLLQGIFLPQGSNLRLWHPQHCQGDSLLLSHPGSPLVLWFPY